MVAFDNTVLSLLIFPDAVQHQGKDATLVEHARERVIGLVAALEVQREHVVVPTPALAELLVTEGADAQDILTSIHRSSVIRVEAFDERAAVELAMRLRDARRAGDQREGAKITKGEMKFDRQIVAIALVAGATVLYSDDSGVATFAAACGLTVRKVADLPIPLTQQALEFPDPPAPEDDSPREEASRTGEPRNILDASAAGDSLDE
jgi:predicted nucleic acid-binding protein